MRRKSFALVAGSNSRRFVFLDMGKGTLSIFIDESGRFQYPDDMSRFYILALVIHDQNFDVSPLIHDLDRNMYGLGVVSKCFHTGPLIRKEKDYSIMTRELRMRIFSRMLAFARKADFRYHCIYVDKNYISTASQLSEKLEDQLRRFLSMQNQNFALFDTVKIYYDCGQATITNMLHRVFDAKSAYSVEFASDVRPDKYKLFQLADLICTLKLISLKIEAGLGMTKSENAFFGGPRLFKRKVLKGISGKGI